MNRILHQLRGPAPGPTLVGLGGVHGNEPAGVEALLRVGEELAEAGLLRGEFVALVGNPPAVVEGVRFLHRDLNRMWDDPEPGADSEGEQLEALRAEFGRIRERSRGPIFLVDLHTTSGDGPPFTVLGDTLANRSMALALPVPMVLGLADAVPGTLIESLDTAGVASVAFESGRHDDPESARRSADALRILVSWLGMSRDRTEYARGSRRRLAVAANGFPSAVRLVHRHSLKSTDEFRMKGGLRSFQEVEQGQVLARQAGRPVRAPTSGRLLLPLYQESGSDGFFMGRPIKRSWLRLSAALRRRRMDRLLRFLPGIRPDRTTPVGGVASFEVHPLIRRIFFPALFRLLGYRARPLDDGRYLLVRRLEPAELASREG